LKIIVGLADLVNLLKPHGAENGREQLHHRIALRSAHLLEAGAAARNESRGEVRPARSLLCVIERVQDLLSLVRGERRKEGIGGVRDVGGCRGLLSFGRCREREESCADDSEKSFHWDP
jgi:hypothetical protein